MIPGFAGALPWETGVCAAAIDIGSNSVRLLLVSDGTNRKFVETTRLAKGLSEAGVLDAERMEQTADAVSRYADLARKICPEVSVFATEAVRKAANREAFCQLVLQKSGCSVRVLTGEEEALCGFAGVSEGKERISVLDIGGASTELVTGRERPEASVSVPVGTVRLSDLCGRDRQALESCLSEQLPAFATVPRAERLFAIGGTATTLASTLLGLSEYDRNRVHGFRIEAEALSELCDLLFRLRVEEIRALPGMDPRRADVVGGGALLLLRFLRNFGFSQAIVSETDNLEGFLRVKRSIG